MGAYSEFLCPLPASFPLARITRGFFESPLYHVVFSAALYLTQQPGAVTVSTQTCSRDMSSCREDTPQFPKRRGNKPTVRVGEAASPRHAGKERLGLLGLRHREEPLPKQPPNKPHTHTALPGPTPYWGRSSSSTRPRESNP